MPIRCIYCQEEKSGECFTRAEHVVPQSFGTFRNNFTLRGIVCNSCNQFFGDNLEIALARDTFEGHSRFAHGVRDSEDFRPFGRGSRIVIRLTEGSFAGAYAYREYSPEVEEIVLRPLPQIGFRRIDSNEYEYFLLDELPERTDLNAMGIAWDHPEAIRAVAVDEATLKDSLAQKGIKFRPRGELVTLDDSESLLCDVEGTVDEIIFRAIAKIALNYLAYWQGAEFVHKSYFDPVRRYIRFSERPSFLLVSVTEQPVLADEPVVGRRRLGHLLTVNWAADGQSIVSQVSLFNWVTYCVSLARDYPEAARDIKKGHFFNVSSGEILALETR